jgi:hypothetical protein
METWTPTPQPTPTGWELSIPRANGADPLNVEVIRPKVHDGVVKLTLVIRCGTTTLATDVLTLTSWESRRRLLKRLEAVQITLDERAILALDDVCRMAGEGTPDAAADERPPVGIPGVVAPPLGELLDALVEFLTTYIVFPDALQAKVVALWVTHTYVLDAFELTPYLSISSAEKRCGKSHLLKLIARLVQRPWLVAAPSAATVFRMIDERRPTMCLDEVDTIFKAKGSEGAEALRGVLNVGNDRDVKVPRCVGQQYERIREFSAFCAKVFTGIGHLPDTVADRSIPLALVRRKKSEPIRRWRWRDIKAAAVDLKSGLTAWATAEIVDILRLARPAIPTGLHDRAEDLWEPLLAIADLAGGTWPGETRNAAVRRAAEADDDPAIGVRFLAALRDVFTSATGSPADEQEPSLFSPDTPKGMPTVAVLAALVERQTDPWGDWWGEDVQRALEKAEKATPPTEPKCPQRPASRLAALLRPFSIQPRNIRTPDGIRKGYVHRDFDDAFERYLDPLEPLPPAPDPGSGTCSGPIPPSGAPTPLQPLGDKDFRRSGWVPPGEEPLHRKPLGEKGCSGVAAEKGEIPPLDHNGGAPTPPTEGRQPPGACPRCGDFGGSRGDGVWNCKTCGRVPVLERDPGMEG